MSLSPGAGWQDSPLPDPDKKGSLPFDVSELKRSHGSSGAAFNPK